MELYVKTRIEWRKWLEKNYDTIGEVWPEWLATAKRADTRLRRIKKIVELSRKNIRPGMI